MRHLVTGGAGFVGSHLCERLIEQGDEVVCVDDFSTGSPANVAHLVGSRFELVRYDVNLPLTLARFDWRVQRVWALACPASPEAYWKDEVRTVTTSVLGTLHALELAQVAGARFLLCSTSEVYGDPEEHPQRESYRGHVDTVGPRACYDEGKRCAEALTAAFARQRGVDVRIARLFNCYGPRMSPGDGRVVPNFLSQALAGKPLTLHGDGGQTRSFAYVTDTVEGLVALMERGPPARPINIGTPDEVTMRQLGELVHRLVADTGFFPCPERLDDPQRRCPDIELAKSFGWEPTVPLEDGLRLTIESFRAGRQP